MNIEIPGAKNVLFRMFLTALSNAIIYFLALVTGITCFFMGCYYVSALILALIGLRVYMDLKAIQEVNQINKAFSNLMSGMQNFDLNTVVP